MTRDTSDFSLKISTLAAEAEGDPRDITAALMRAALDTGIRKELRATVQLALEQATGTAPKELTDLACRRLRTGSRLADPQYAGLILIASKRGKRWLYRTQADGTQRQLTIGHYPSMTLAEAREKWATVRSEGLDGKTADTRSQTTLEALADAYADAQQAKGIRSWKMARGTIEKHLLIHHRHMTIGAVSKELLDATFEHLIDTQPGAAHNIRMAISGLFTWAEETGKMPTGMPALKLRKTPKSEIKTFVPSTPQLRTMLRGLDGLKPVDADIMRLQALTGTRISEAAGADWSEIDLAEGRWIIPAERMKAKKPHTVMLSRQAIALLERQSGRTGPIFGNRGRRGVSGAWSAQRDALGLPKAFTSHVVRKALLTWMAENGAGKDLRDRMSAHSPGKTADAHYMLSELNGPAAEWWQRWADHLTAIEAENVVLLEDRA